MEADLPRSLLSIPYEARVHIARVRGARAICTRAS